MTPKHPRDMTQEELAEAATRLCGLLCHLRDFIAQALELEDPAKEEAMKQATKHAYDLVYIEYVPADALEQLAATGYDLPSFAERPQEELYELVQDISWLALDLAQSLAISTEAYKPEYKPEAYQHALVMAKELADFPIADVRSVGVSPGLAVFGARGLENWTR